MRSLELLSRPGLLRIGKGVTSFAFASPMKTTFNILIQPGSPILPYALLRTEWQSSSIFSIWYNVGLHRQVTFTPQGGPVPSEIMYTREPIASIGSRC